MRVDVPSRATIRESPCSARRSAAGASPATSTFVHQRYRETGRRVGAAIGSSAGGSSPREAASAPATMSVSA